jgi:hypothetical protein
MMYVVTDDDDDEIDEATEQYGVQQALRLINMMFINKSTQVTIV